MKSKDKKCVQEKQVGALLFTASGTTISAIAAKQINQIPTVLHQVLFLSSSSLISMKKNKNLSTQIKQKEPNTHVKQKWPRWKVHSCILPSCGRATKMTVIRLERSKMKRTGSPLWVFKCSIEHPARQPSRAEANPRPIRLQRGRYFCLSCRELANPFWPPFPIPTIEPTIEARNRWKDKKCVCPMHLHNKYVRDLNFCISC